jgi:uncharacterized protein YndB with AHSA1/START domain
MEQLLLTKSIWINAPREKVWRAITDPVQFQQWFSPPTPWTLSALEVGGIFSPTGFEQWASVIQVVNAPHTFSYRYQAPQEDGSIAMVATYVLEEENGGTRVTLTETGFKDENAVAQNVAGWDMGFANLEAYLTGKDLPYPQGL